MIVTNEDIAGSLLPNVNISRIILQSTEEDKLLANIQLLFRQSFSNDDVSSWLEDSTALQYLKIFVIQSTNPKATERLKLAFDSTKERGFFSNADQFSQYKRILRNENIISNFSEIEYKEINLFDLAGPGAKNKLQELVKNGKAERIVDNNGNNIYNIYIDIDFERIAEENTEHLSFLVGTTYDLSSLIGQVEQQGAFAIQVGEIFVESVISNGLVEQTSTVYVDEAEQLWPGPVHLINRNGQTVFRSGQTETANSVDLFVREVENYKIQDLRQLRAVKNFLNTIVVPDSEELDNVETAIRNQFSDYDNSFISEAHTSIDALGNATINFFIDLKKMFIKNSIIGLVLSKSANTRSADLIEQYYKYMSIEAVTLFAKRIDIDESLTPNKTTEKIVCQLLERQQIEAAIKNIFLPGNIRAGQNIEQLIMLSLFHTEQLKQGSYEYRLELEIKEDLVTPIKNIKTNLEIEKSAIVEYYNNSILPGNFNETTNRFRNGAFNNVQVPTAQSFRTLLQTLQKIFNLTTATSSDQTTISPEPLSSILTKWANPIQGTPTTISYILDTYDIVIKALQDSIESTSVVNNSLNEKGDAFATQQRVTAAAKTLKIQKNFSSNINFESEYLLEYLDHTRRDTSGINSEGSFLYDVIKTDLISKKYDINSKNTSTRNLNEQNEVVFNKLGKILTDLADLEVEIFSEPLSNQNINLGAVRELQTSVDSRIVNPFREAVSDRSRNFTINDKKVLNTLFSTLISPTVDKSPKQLEIIFDTSNDDNIFEKITPTSATILGGTDVINLIKNTKTSTRNLTVIPNHIKSLIKNKTEQTGISLSDAEVRLKYELINTVMCLTGFEFDQETKTFKVQEPRWANVNRSIILSLPETTGQFLFCKMQPYDFSDISYKHNQALTNTFINECFLISATEINPSPNSITSISKQRYENRCNFEIQKYFNNEQEPEVSYSINGRNVLRNDSYETTKYSFLAPHGIQISGVFRSLSLTEARIIDNDNITIRPPNISPGDLVPKLPRPPIILPPQLTTGMPIMVNQTVAVAGSLALFSRNNKFNG
jgi:hypothetical protein